MAALPSAKRLPSFSRLKFFYSFKLWGIRFTLIALTLTTLIIVPGIIKEKSGLTKYFQLKALHQKIKLINEQRQKNIEELQESIVIERSTREDKRSLEFSARADGLIFPNETVYRVLPVTKN